MNLHLHGKRALITGSTAGIGFAVASALAQEGATVIINGRTAARVESAVSELRKRLPDAKVEGWTADVTQATDVLRLCAAAPAIDILVNNVGAYEVKPFAECTDADWLRLIETNFMSGVRLTRHYLPGMVERNWGRVIFVSSDAAIDVPPAMIHYGVTKVMQVALARGLAKSVAGTAVTINSIIVGPTKSEGGLRTIQAMAKGMATDEAGAEAEFFRSVRTSSIIRRFGEPDEVAALCAFLASPLAAATTGAAVRCEGGLIDSIL